MAAHTIKPIFHVTAVNTGGRNGHAETGDKSVAVDLGPRKDANDAGRPGTTTPEHLFAAGYAACFGGAVEFAAGQHKKDASGMKTACTVSFGPREAAGYGVAVAMEVSAPKMSQADAEAMVTYAHDVVCPYSHATRGNIDVTFTVKGGA
jgi:lipoyl-dependent peroxiredoxin